MDEAAEQQQERPPVAGQGGKRRRLRPRVLLVTLAAVPGLVGAYALTGYYLVPRLIRSQATQWVRTELGKSLALGAIRFDPFRFTLDIDDFAIDAPPGKAMVAFGHLHLDFSVRSLFQHAWRFDAVRLDAPRVDAVLRPDGSLNLSELIPPSKPGAKASPTPAVRIDRFVVDRGWVRYTDARSSAHPQMTLRPVGFALRDFQTDTRQGGVFTLRATSLRGEHLDWAGTVSLASMESRGRLTLRGVQAATVRDFLGALLPVRLNAGQIGLTGRYALSLGAQGLRLTAAMPDVTLEGLALEGAPGSGLDGRATIGRITTRIDRLSVATGGRDGVRIGAALSGLALSDAAMRAPFGLRGAAVQIDRLALETGTYDSQAQALVAGPAGLDGFRLTDPRALGGEALRFGAARLSGGRVDLATRKVALGRLTVTGADLPLRREADGSINWQKLVPVATGRAASPAPAAAAPWAVTLEQAALGGATLRFEDRAVAPVARFVLRPLTLTATGLGSDLSRPVSVRFGATLDGRTPVRGEGQVVPARAVVDMRFAFSNLPLRALDPYVPRTPGLVVRSGQVGASGLVHLEGGDLAALWFRGAATVSNFIADDTISRRPMVAWRAFALEGIDYRAGGLTIERGRLSAPLGRVEIMPDGTFNYTAVTGGGAAAVPADGAAPAPGNGTPAPTPADSPAENAPRVASAAGASAAGAALSAPAAPVAPAAPPAAATKVTVAQTAAGPSVTVQPALPVRLKHLQVSGGRMAFADQSIDPHFEAEILGLTGALTNISNAPGTITDVDLSGHVIDRFSPVTIKGRMDLMGYDRRTDMHVAFRNIELPVFNPYSGRYAGYAIAKGKLTARFDYRIEDRALKADHHVIIDQIKWGEATESKQKVPMPIRLATALLKDKNGVIDLDVPVTGSLDDPKFRIAPIVWKIVGNVIEKAITAPFRLLGSIFGGAEKARYVDFAPGSAVLPTGATEAFAGLAKALEDRDELELDIPAGPGIREDAVALADRRIDAVLMAKEARKGEPTDFAALKPGEQHDRLKALFHTKLGRKPDFAALKDEAAGEAARPAGEKGGQGSGKGRAKPLSEGDRRRQREIDWMRDQLRTPFLPSAAELEKLGRDRALAVRDALLADGKIDPTRLFLVTGDTLSAREGTSRMELKLK